LESKEIKMRSYYDVVSQIIQAERIVDWILEIEEMTGGLMPSERTMLEANQKVIDNCVMELGLC
jgi:hypothetical protein